MNNKLPSNRNFGIVFFIVFLVIGLWPLLNQSELRIWSLLISMVFLFLGILNSKILTPLNKLWMKFGLLLGNIIAPIVMGIVYFGVVTPTGLLLRLIGKDILMLKKNKNSSYWLNKDNKNNNMKNQF
jgi:predicted membrane protein